MQRQACTHINRFDRDTEEDAYIGDIMVLPYASMHSNDFLFEGLDAVWSKACNIGDHIKDITRDISLFQIRAAY